MRIPLLSENETPGTFFFASTRFRLTSSATATASKINRRYYTSHDDRCQEPAAKFFYHIFPLRVITKWTASPVCRSPICCITKEKMDKMRRTTG